MHTGTPGCGDFEFSCFLSTSDSVGGGGEGLQARVFAIIAIRSAFF